MHISSKRPNRTGPAHVPQEHASFGLQAACTAVERKMKRQAGRSSRTRGRVRRTSPLILLIFAAFALARPAAAEDSPDSLKPTTYLNESTPDWLRFAAVFRTRVEGRTGIGFRERVEDGYGLTRLRLDIELQPKSWVVFFAQFQDSRSPGKNNSTAFFRDPFDLRRAYVNLAASTPEAPSTLLRLSQLYRLQSVMNGRRLQRAQPSRGLDTPLCPRDG